MEVAASRDTEPSAWERLMGDTHIRVFRVVVLCLEEDPDAEQATIQERALCNRLGGLAETEITHHEHKRIWALRRLVFMYWIFCGTRNAWEWDVERIREERRREQEERGPSDDTYLDFLMSRSFTPARFAASVTRN